MPEVLSTKEVAELLGRTGWQIRVIVDSLSRPVPRIGRQRAIPVSRVPEISRAADERFGKVNVQEATA